MNVAKIFLSARRDWKNVFVIFLFCAATVIASPAQTFTSLASFNGSNGQGPISAPVQGIDGNFYGTTPRGGFNSKDSDGTVFKVTSVGVLTALSLCTQTPCTNGANPTGLVLADDGNFYGTTQSAGANGLGTIFKITSGGALTVLHSFAGSDGAIPFGELVQGSDGSLYGTTSAGGAHTDGTVFKITTAGVLTTLYSFCSRKLCADGYDPTSGLVEGNDGNLYGTTIYGGAYEPKGTVFRITRAGVLTRLYSFCTQQQSACPDGSNPETALALGSDGNFYGTTASGGSADAGTVFKISPSGALTTLHSFCSQPACSDGTIPSGLTQATDGNFYGVTAGGGGSCGVSIGCGTIFQITPAGSLTTLYNFSGTDGFGPEGGLLQGTDGILYGTTAGGGTGGLNDLNGTVFSLSMGLGPFVKSTQESGKMGQTGGILGQGFTGATGVAFNGTPANFTVVSDTYIKATVPAGATSGYITVNTPTGTLTSNVVFHVGP